MVVAYGMDPQEGQSLDAFCFSLCSMLCSCISLDRSNSELVFLRWVDGTIPQPVDMPKLWKRYSHTIVIQQCQPHSDNVIRIES